MRACCDCASPHTESPVHILSPQDKVSLTFTTSERVVLTCELSRVDFPASWYKDGQKVEESESLVVKADGRKHRLILPAAGVGDSGEFECRTEAASAFFSVTIQGRGPWWPGLLQLRLTQGSVQTLPPGLPASGVPSRESLAGQQPCVQVPLRLLLNPPMHLPATQHLLGWVGGTKFS